MNIIYNNLNRNRIQYKHWLMRNWCFIHNLFKCGTMLSKKKIIIFSFSCSLFRLTLKKLPQNNEYDIKNGYSAKISNFYTYLFYKYSIFQNSPDSNSSTLNCIWGMHLILIYRISFPLVMQVVWFPN